MKAYDEIRKRYFVGEHQHHTANARDISRIIFTTMVDRLILQSSILDRDGTSYRQEQPEKYKQSVAHFLANISCSKSEQ